MSSFFQVLALSWLTTGWAAQPFAPEPIPVRLRDLPWAQLNFLHTTDTHGWLAGHLQEASYAADWGDYVSLATHMREKVDTQGWDLLLIDTGDRVEGNGLYDSSKPKGLYLSDILKQQHIDLLTCGNHELYHQKTSEAEFQITVPNFREKYLASNIDIIDPQSGELVPLAPRFKKFTTNNQKIRIAAFGFLFDFTYNSNNTVVTPVEKAINSPWFLNAIQDEDIDLFLVIGHVPVRSNEYEAIFRKIRKYHLDTPIQFFGGHSHIRDFAEYDSTAYGLASGRFMETIGFMSIDGLTIGGWGTSRTRPPPTFSRRYIDNNLYSFFHHTGLDGSTFHTEHGQNVSRMIQTARKALHLDGVHGCAPKDLWMDRVPFPSDDSIYTWLEEVVLPGSLRDESRRDKLALAIVNTGAIRFDIFKGPFTHDSTFIVSPFTSHFRYVKDVPYETTKKILEYLNRLPKVLAETPLDEDLSATLGLLTHTNYRPGVNGEMHSVHNPEMKYDTLAGQITLSDVDRVDLNTVPGYTTKDDGGDDGDDTIHSTIPFFDVPSCIQATILPDSSAIPNFELGTISSRSQTMDLVYIDFIESHMVDAANSLGYDIDFEKDAQAYMPGVTLTDLIVSWIQENWKCRES